VIVIYDTNVLFYSFAPISISFYYTTLPSVCQVFSETELEDVLKIWWNAVLKTFEDRN